MPNTHRADLDVLEAWVYSEAVELTVNVPHVRARDLLHGPPKKSINKMGLKINSGFETCFAPSNFGAWAETHLKWRLLAPF